MEDLEAVEAVLETVEAEVVAALEVKSIIIIFFVFPNYHVKIHLRWWRPRIWGRVSRRRRRI